MKNVLFSILFSTMNFLSFAQTPFTEKIVNDMNQRLLKDPVQVLKTEVASTTDYYLIGGEGHKYTYAEVLGLFEANEMTNSAMSDVAVKQYGNIGMATGILSHSFKNKKSGDTRSTTERFTYIHEFKNGKWKYVSGQHSPIQSSAAEDEAAIKKLITDQTQGTYDKDLTKVLSCWVKSPRATMVNATLNQEIIGYEMIKAAGEAYVKSSPMPEKAKITQKFLDIKINGNSAWVSHEELIEREAPKSFLSHRYLEKVNGEWKILSAMTQAVKYDQATEEANIKAVLEGETKAYHAGNTEGVQSQWKFAPYTRGMATTVTGQTLYGSSGEEMKKFYETLKPDNNTFSNANYNIKICSGSTMAWVTYDQTTTSAEDKTLYLSRETRCLERVSGAWKIVLVSSHHYNK